MDKPFLDATSAGVDQFTPCQVTRLLILSSGSPSPAADIDADDVGRLLTRQCNSRGKSSQALFVAAAAPASSPEELRRIKDLAKELLDGAEGPDESEAARLLYHLAVAAALGHHGEDISTRPHVERRLIYDRLALVFSGHAIADVFRLAVTRIAGASSRSPRSFL